MNDVIHLTRLNNQPLLLNSDLIKWIETAPDTVITLTTGEKFIVRDSPESVVEQVIEFRRAIGNACCVIRQRQHEMSNTEMRDSSEE